MKFFHRYIITCNMNLTFFFILQIRLPVSLCTFLRVSLCSSSLRHSGARRSASRIGMGRWSFHSGHHLSSREVCNKSLWAGSLKVSHFCAADTLNRRAIIFIEEKTCAFKLSRSPMFMRWWLGCNCQCMSLLFRTEKNI